MKFSNDALLLMAHICNPRSYALPGRMYQWFLSQFYAAFTTTIESSMIPLASDDQHHDVDSKISKAPNNHKDEAVKDSVLLDRANDDKNANDNDDNLVSFVLKEPDLGRLAVQKTVVDKTRPEEDNYSIDQDSNGSTDWFHCAFSVGAYFYVDASSEPCPYGYPQEEDCCSSIPYGWDNGVYYTTSREEEESAYASGIKEEVPYSIPQDTAWASDARGLQTAPPVCTGEIYNVKAMSLPDFQQLVMDCLEKSNISCPNKKLECWNVEKIKDMEYVFAYQHVPPGVARWDMSNVESVKRMFEHANVGEVDFSYWKLKSVDSLHRMFFMADNVRGISDWDVSRVTSLRTTFATNYRFNDPDLSQWDVSRVVDMSYAFSRVANFPTSIWNWDVRNVKSVKHMFIHDHYDPSWWDISKLSLQLWELNEEVDVDEMFGEDTLSEVANIDNHDQVRRLCPYINARWRDDPAFFNDWNKIRDSNGHDIGIDCYCPKGQKIKVTNPEFLLYKGCIFDHTKCLASKFGIQPGCWDMSEVTMHFEVFRNKLVPAAIWGWNVGKMIPKAFFKEAIFNDPLGIRNFEFQSGVDASSMFENADFGPYFASVDISKMKLTTAENMFRDATLGNKHLAERFGIDDTFVGSTDDIDSWSDRDIRNLSSYIRFKRKGNPVCDAV